MLFGLPGPRLPLTSEPVCLSVCVLFYASERRGRLGASYWDCVTDSPRYGPPRDLSPTGRGLVPPPLWCGKPQLAPRPGGPGCCELRLRGRRASSVFRHPRPALCRVGPGGLSSSQPAAPSRALGGEGREGRECGRPSTFLWVEPVGRVLEAPCPSGAHRGLCLVWGEQETPHPGEKPSQPQGGPGHHFLCRWTHPGWFASGSWWGGGSGYREAGSSLPRLPALSYRTHCRGGGSIVGMAV